MCKIAGKGTRDANGRNEAARALSLLTADERKGVLRYYHVKDAKMSLASQLLKHLAIVELCHVGWHESTITRDAHGKPCYVPSSGKTIDFNVSHQAGIVSLIAGPGEVGTDVVCVNERNEHAILEKEGFFHWVDIHADVFSPDEVRSLKFDSDALNLDMIPAGYGRDAIVRCQHPHQRVSWTSAGKVESLDGSVVMDAKLRRFFAIWCLREAYVKMTGEALLAAWLRNLEFKGFRAPRPSSQSTHDTLDLTPGEVVVEFDIYLKGKRVENVAMELRALGQNYMVASAVKVTDAAAVDKVVFPGYTELDLDRDIYRIAEEPAC